MFYKIDTCTMKEYSIVIQQIQDVSWLMKVLFMSNPYLSNHITEYIGNVTNIALTMQKTMENVLTKLGSIIKEKKSSLTVSFVE